MDICFCKDGHWIWEYRDRGRDEVAAVVGFVSTARAAKPFIPTVDLAVTLLARSSDAQDLENDQDISSGPKDAGSLTGIKGFGQAK